MRVNPMARGGVMLAPMAVMALTGLAMISALPLESVPWEEVGTRVLMGLCIWYLWKENNSRRSETRQVTEQKEAQGTEHYRKRDADAAALFALVEKTIRQVQVSTDVAAASNQLAVEQKEAMRELSATIKLFTRDVVASAKVTEDSAKMLTSAIDHCTAKQKSNAGGHT